MALTIEDLGGWPGVLALATAPSGLTTEQAGAALSDILEGNATSAQIAGFAIALRTRGETIAEMTGLVRTMLDFAERVQAGPGAIDTCGTGGDRSPSVKPAPSA